MILTKPLIKQMYRHLKEPKKEEKERIKKKRPKKKNFHILKEKSGKITIFTVISRFF